MTYYKTWQTKGQDKYRAIKSTYNGSVYDSKKEAGKAMELTQRVKDKEIVSWEKQVREELFGQFGTKVCTYICDFVIYHLDGTKEYLEIKSKITATPIWRLKWKLLQDKYKSEMKSGEIRLTVEY